MMKDARATVNTARPSRSSLEKFVAKHNVTILDILAYPYTSVQNVPFAIERCTWSLLYVSLQGFSLLDYVQGYNEQSPVTRVNSTDRYLGHDDDAK